MEDFYLSAVRRICDGCSIWQAELEGMRESIDLRLLEFKFFGRKLLWSESNVKYISHYAHD